MQHQTSTHAGNILSRYGNPCKLDPCPIVCYVLVLTKEQGKGKWALPKKKSCQGFGRLFGTGRMFGTPFFKTNPEELSTLCIYPEKLLNTTKNVSINKTLSITNFAHDFYPATLEEHPMNNNDIHRVALAQHLLYHSPGQMLRREQSKGHRKGTRAWQKDIQSLWSKSFLLIWGR